MTGLLADAEDEQKALVVFVVIAKAFQQDDMFNLGDFFGRFRLYRLLLKSRIDPQKLKNHMDKILQFDKSKQFFHHKNNLNLIIPESVEEMNLRIRYLLSSSTSVHTLAMEGGKRQTVALWNDLNLEIQETPIHSFMDITNNDRLGHRKLPDLENEVQLRKRIQNLSHLYYSRSNVPIQSMLYSGNPTACGYTINLVYLVYLESINIANEMKDIEGRDINIHLAMVVRECMKKPNILNAVEKGIIEISPVEVNKELANFEKDPLLHFLNVGRFLMEETAKLSKENLEIKAIFESWIEKLAVQYLFYLEGKQEKFQKIRPSNETKDNKVLTQMDLFVKHRLQLRNDPRYYLEHGFDECLTEKTLQPPETQASSNYKDSLRNPSDVKFFYGFWLMTRQKVTNVAQAPFAMSNWEPFHHLLYILTFSVSMNSKENAKNFEDLLLSNGIKDRSRYPDGFTHDVYEQDLGQDYVSANIFI